MEDIIRISNLVKHFDKIAAVDDISFNVGKGELFGFLGINGAGKSTTINMLCTLYSPTSGKAIVCGHELGKDNDAIRRKIGVVFQNNSLDDRLSVKQNLITRGYLYDKDSAVVKRNFDMVTEILELNNMLNRRFYSL